MTVSLLVGTVRTLSEFTTSPGEILAGMNVRMLSRTGGGFTTCLIMRVEPNGRCIVANAGHLAPYLNGQETEVTAGLPLGLHAGTVYPETTLRLDVGQQLTLLTDGVVEARTRGGELLGFDRTAALASKSAEAIAQSAQDFGQEDDITVLTVKRLAVGEEPAIRVATSMLAAEVG
jgi:serine phosphatase RsbU (regulator of sigma subunit)